MEQSKKTEGRESRKDNDLFFTCSLIEYIARKTQNKRADVVNALGRKNVEKIYELADVYHSDNIDRVSDDFIHAAGITVGSFDNVAAAEYSVPSHWDIGKVYKRLILGIAKEKACLLYTSPLFSASQMRLAMTARVRGRKMVLYRGIPKSR